MEIGAQESLLEKIERARQKMHALASAGAGYEDILQASRELDRLIAGFYKKNPGGRQCTCGEPGGKGGGGQ